MLNPTQEPDHSPPKQPWSVSATATGVDALNKLVLSNRSSAHLLLFRGPCPSGEDGKLGKISTAARRINRLVQHSRPQSSARQLVSFTVQTLHLFTLSIFRRLYSPSSLRYTTVALQAISTPRDDPGKTVPLPWHQSYLRVPA